MKTLKTNMNSNIQGREAYCITNRHIIYKSEGSEKKEKGSNRTVINYNTTWKSTMLPARPPARSLARSPTHRRPRSLARCQVSFQFGAFHFDAFPIFVSTLIQDSRLFSFLRRPVWRARRIYLCSCFLSAHVFCEEVLSTPICREATLLQGRSRRSGWSGHGRTNNRPGNFNLFNLFV